MRTPVIIPAYNEADRIQAALSNLPQDETYPIVAVNGSSDNTAEIARSFGAQTHVVDEQGKMPAIQSVLRSLGEQALEPIIILDADTRPIFPRHWRSGLVALLSATKDPAVVGGPIIYTGQPRGEALLRTAYRAARAAKFSGDTTISRSVQFGPNMAIKLASDTVLKAVQGLPNYWPSEDKALAQTIIDHGGTYTGSVDPRLLTLTPTSISAISLTDRIKLGAAETKRVVEQRYIERAAPASMPYESDI